MGRFLGSMASLEVVRDAQKVAEFLASVSSAPFLALDTETSGLDSHTDIVLLIQFGTATQQLLVDAQAIPPPPSARSSAATGWW